MVTFEMIPHESEPQRVRTDYRALFAAVMADAKAALADALSRLGVSALTGPEKAATLAPFVLVSGVRHHAGFVQAIFFRSPVSGERYHIARDRHHAAARDCRKRAAALLTGQPIHPPRVPAAALESARRVLRHPESGDLAMAGTYAHQVAQDCREELAARHAETLRAAETVIPVTREGRNGR